jgi:hypothetical protein
MEDTSSPDILISKFRVAVLNKGADLFFENFSEVSLVVEAENHQIC